MKKNRLTKNFLCAAVSVMLAIGDCAGGVVCAAADDAQTAEILVPRTPGEQASPDTSDAQSGLTDEELAAYYKDSVFIGDSIMLGFRNYSAKQKSYVHDIQFLAAGSYSALNAMKPVAGDNVHPMYKGRKYQVWKAVPLIGSKRAFILLGMNDISILGLEGARDKYKELIDKILETSPDIEIHIISVTYTLANQGKGKLNNKNIAQYNTLLQEMAEENGWGYVDLCTPISDGLGNLAANHCSDGFVHLANSAYALWETELADYANAQAGTKEMESESEPQTETNANSTKNIVPADAKTETPATAATESALETGPKNTAEANPAQTTKGRNEP